MRQTSRRRLIGLLVFVSPFFIFGALSTGCGNHDPTDRPDQSSTDSKRPPIVFVVLDTTRADHLSAYGYPMKTTPTLDRILGEDAVRFDKMVAASNNTFCSHASMFTGLHVKTHGVARVHKGFKPLAQSFKTLAETLRDSGYYTLGIVSSSHINPKYSSFDQGFERFLRCPISKDHPKRPSEESNLDLLPAIKEAVAEHGDRPLFLFVHYFDAHYRYDPPEELATKVQSNPTVTLRPNIIPTGFENGANGKRLRQRLERSISLYDGEILRADTSLAQVLRTLDEQGILKDAVIVVTADHGENLGENGLCFNHSGLGESVVHSPLIIRIPGVTSRGSIDALAHHTDIMPTLLEVAGVPRTAWPPLEGKSLIPLLQPEPTTNTIHEFVFSEAVQATEKMIRDSRYKLIIGSYGSSHLFDLDEDPDEKSNIATEAPEVARRLRDRLLEFLGTTTFSVQLTAGADRKASETIRGCIWAPEPIATVEPGAFAPSDRLISPTSEGKPFEFEFILDAGQSKGLRFDTRFGPTLLRIISDVEPVRIPPEPFGDDREQPTSLPVVYPPKEIAGWPRFEKGMKAETLDPPLVFVRQTSASMDQPSSATYRVVLLGSEAGAPTDSAISIRIATSGKITDLEKTEGALLYKDLGNIDRFRAQTKNPGERAVFNFTVEPMESLVAFEAKIGRHRLHSTQYRIDDLDDSTAYPDTLMLTPDLYLPAPPPESIDYIRSHPGLYLWSATWTTGTEEASEEMMEMLKNLGYIPDEDDEN